MRAYPKVATLAVATLMLAGWAGGAHAQGSSTGFRLWSAGMGLSHSSGSTNFRVRSDVGGTTGGERTSNGTSADLITGHTGVTVLPAADVTHATASGSWHSIAFPVRSTSNTVTSVLDELGSFNDRDWRFGHWLPLLALYSEAGASSNPLTTIAAGQGYWLRTRENKNVVARGLPTPTKEFRVPLSRGPANAAAWNQVGNPFLFPIRVADLRVTDGITTYQLTAAANVFTERVAKVWSAGAYVDATVINGRTAFWVKNLAAANYTLIIPAVASATGSPEPNLVKPEGSHWAVALSARQGERLAEPFMIGSAPVARGEWNALCRSVGPPPPEGQALRLSTSRAGWGPMSDDYVRVFQGTDATSSWDFTVSGAESPGEVTLEVRGFDLPVGSRMWLSDAAAGWTREVRDGEHVTLAAGAGPKDYRLEVTSGNESLVNGIAEDHFRIAYPNPFRGSTGLTFALARQGDVAVEIFDLQGRLVRSLSRRGLSAGEHVMVWDGRDAGGQSVLSGVYLARWSAGATRGTGRLVKVN